MMVRYRVRQNSDTLKNRARYFDNWSDAIENFYEKRIFLSDASRARDEVGDRLITIARETAKNEEDFEHGNYRVFIPKTVIENWRQMYKNNQLKLKAMSITDYENYFKQLFANMDSIKIGDESVQYYNKDGWFLTYEKGDKEYWLKDTYFTEVERRFFISIKGQTAFDKKQIKELCTEFLNELLGRDATTTHYSGAPVLG